MSAPVYSVPGQTEWRRKAFLEWKGIDLSHELSLKYGDNVNYYKSVHHSYSISIHPGNFKNKSVSSAFSWVSRYILVLVKLKGARREATFKIILHQEYLVVIRDEKVSPFCGIEIILPLLRFLLDPLTNKHCKTWSCIINFWIDSRTYKK